LLSAIASLSPYGLTRIDQSEREIAAERGIFEKEKLSGLNPLAYIGSKAAFLSVSAAAD
jgi:hypothetical protein